MAAKKKARGRPELYTRPIAEEILTRLSEGESLNSICKSHKDDKKWPSHATVRIWAKEDKDGFAAKYAEARTLGYELLADELLEIADDDTHDRHENGTLNGEFVARSNLRVNTRKWMLARMLPKVYGDKVEVGGSLTVHIGDGDDEL